MSVASLASFEYLENLPGTTFRKLYQQPSTALAIFRRMLPHLAKTFVMAMLYMPNPLPLPDLEAWVLPGSKSEQAKALSILYRLHIVTASAATREDPSRLSLTHNFATSLRIALTGGGDHQSFGVPSSEAGHGEIDIATLDRYARAQWEGILHFVVNSAVGSAQPGTQYPKENVQQLLLLGHLIDKKNRHSGLGITQAGFTFLLQEVNTQVWTLLLLWISNAEKLNMDSVEVLSFLFLLGSLELGLAYSTATLTPSQKAMLPNLADFGLIYLPDPSHPRDFYPTRLSTTLTSDATALRSIASGFESAARTPTGPKGFIVIETNYRLYAYTTSPLQIAVLALFTKLATRYPNMVSGRITRESIRAAIEAGITSDQIIAYLQTHAHPQMRKRTAHGQPLLPPTVVDQIRLWQIENERMQAEAGYLFKDFATQAEYDEVVKYADTIGVLSFRNDVKRIFFVTRVEQLRDFVKARKVK